jgi:hypothetical protein
MEPEKLKPIRHQSLPGSFKSDLECLRFMEGCAWVFISTIRIQHPA